MERKKGGRWKRCGMERKRERQGSREGLRWRERDRQRERGVEKVWDGDKDRREVEKV